MKTARIILTFIFFVIMMCIFSMSKCDNTHIHIKIHHSSSRMIIMMPDSAYMAQARIPDQDTVAVYTLGAILTMAALMIFVIIYALKHDNQKDPFQKQVHRRYSWRLFNFKRKTNGNK